MISKVLKTLLLLLWAVYAGAVHSATRSSDLILVSDIDDTAKITQIKPKGNYLDLLKNVVKNQEFLGMSTLYRAFKSQGASVQYVTTAPKILKGLVLDFLHKNNFPIGKTWTRPDLRIKSEEFKFNTMKTLMLKHPDKRFVFVGDNGEYDWIVFERLKADPQVGERVVKTYLHTIYDRRLSDSSSKPFLTAADLALDMQSEGFIDKDDLRQVLVSTRNALRGKGAEKVLPEFAEVDRNKIQTIFNDTDYPSTIRPNRLVAEIRDRLMKLADERQTKASFSKRCMTWFRQLAGATN